MKKNSVSEFELEKQDFKIRLKRGGNAGWRSQLTRIPKPGLHSANGSPAGSGGRATPAPLPASAELDIKSPMIGTFYRAPSPESASYVEVGTEVNPETVVCIIEAMR